MPTSELLAKAVQYLAANCDGAVQQDAKGFNGPDSRFGKALAAISPEAWSEGSQREAWEMLSKYRGQLASGGIDYDAIPEPSKVKGQKFVRAVDVKAGKILVFLPYGDSAYPKGALNAMWNRELRGWQVSVSKYGSVLDWAKQNNVPVTERAKALLESAPKPEHPDYIGKAVFRNGEIVMAFDYNPSLVDAVRSIPGRRWNGVDKTWVVPKETVSIVRKLASDYNIELSKGVLELPEVEITTGPKISVQGRDFAISFTYDAQLLSAVRQMPGSSWSPALRTWVVPIESVDEVLKFSKEFNAAMSPEAVRLVDEASIVQEIIEASAAKDAQITIKGFGSETLQLFPFQRAGVAYALRAMGWEHTSEGVWERTKNTGEGGVIVGDEMGLGKTCQGLGILQATQSFPAVIICPASLKFNWEREAHNWLGEAGTVILEGTTKPNLRLSLPRSVFLDEQVRFQLFRKIQDIKLTSDDPTVLSSLRREARLLDERANITATTKTGKPVHQTLVSVVNDNSPSLAGFGNASLAINDSSDVSELGNIVRQVQGATLKSPISRLGVGEVVQSLLESSDIVDVSGEVLDDFVDVVASFSSGDGVGEFISAVSNAHPIIIICNYDILTHWVERFTSVKGIVLDESHYVKNGAAQRSKAAIKLSDKVVENGVRVCLSGTPIVNQPLELMTQLRIVHRLDDFGGASSFRNVYGRASAKSLASLNRKLRSMCYVRRRKADVLTELPPKRWSSVVVEGDAAVMKEYKKAEADIVKYLSQLAMQFALESGASSEEARKEAWMKALRARAAEQLVAISTLKQLAAKAKMKVAKQWVEDFLANDKKLVVFGWHRTVVDDIAVNFANGVKIQGGISSEKRQEAVDLFQNSDEQKVIACNIKAAGVGLTLTAASDVLFIEQGWTPSDMEQGADRCHRIGQKDSVTAWLMLTADTIDEDIAALIQHKRSIVDRAIDGTDEDEDEEGSIVGDLLVSLAERGLQQTS